jgi:hypothetical protein
VRRTTETTLATLALLLVVSVSGAAAKAVLHPAIGWGPISDAAAARKVVRSGDETRPANATENHTVPTRAQLRFFHRKSNMPYAAEVDGRFKGTTDEIIQWAAYKWGLPEDTLRGAAAVETWWDMDFVGDNGDSFGIFQVRRPYHCCLPFMRDSTAFNADYYAAIIRSYYDGKQDWLNNPDVAVQNGAPYEAGDLWGSVGAWLTGRWHLPANDAYVAKVQARIAERVWLTPDFLSYLPL